METRSSIFNNVKNDRQFRSNTDLLKEEFKKLSERFVQFYKPKVYQVTENYTFERAIQDPSEGLFLVLCYKKISQLSMYLGFVLGFQIR